MKELVLAAGSLKAVGSRVHMRAATNSEKGVCVPAGRAVSQCSRTPPRKSQSLPRGWRQVPGLYAVAGQRLEGSGKVEEQPGGHGGLSGPSPSSLVSLGCLSLGSDEIVAVNTWELKKASLQIAHYLFNLQRAKGCTLIKGRAFLLKFPQTQVCSGNPSPPPRILSSPRFWVISPSAQGKQPCPRPWKNLSKSFTKPQYFSTALLGHLSWLGAVQRRGKRYQAPAGTHPRSLLSEMRLGTPSG